MTNPDERAAEEYAGGKPVFDPLDSEQVHINIRYEAFLYGCAHKAKTKELAKDENEDCGPTARHPQGRGSKMKNTRHKVQGVQNA